MGAPFIMGAIAGSQLYTLLYRLVLITVSGGAEIFATLPVTFVCACAILAFAGTAGFAQYAPLGSRAYVTTQLLAMRTTGYISDNDVAIACNDLSRPAYIAVASIVLAACGCLVLGTGVALAAATFCRLRRVTLFSERTRKMHAELTRLLLIQVHGPSKYNKSDNLILDGCSVCRRAPSGFRLPFGNFVWHSFESLARIREHVFINHVSLN